MQIKYAGNITQHQVDNGQDKGLELSLLKCFGMIATVKQTILKFGVVNKNTTLLWSHKIIATYHITVKVKWQKLVNATGRMAIFQ